MHNAGEIYYGTMAILAGMALIGIGAVVGLVWLAVKLWRKWK